MSIYFVAFFTGLLTGGMSCLALQGGLLAAVIANSKEKFNRSHLFIVMVFITAKIAAYTVLGFILGSIGTAVQISLTAVIVMQVVILLFLLGTALNLLNVHPIFRYLAVNPPRFLYRFTRQQSRAGTWFAPALVGAMTVFIPCGVTQAMMVQSMSSGSPFAGALTLFAFILGTTPLFVLFGVLLQTLSGAVSSLFTKFAAVLVIILAVWNLGHVATIMNLRPDRWTRSLYCEFVYCPDDVNGTAESQKPTTTPTITINATSYSVDNPYIPAGAEIHVKVINKMGQGCIQAFTIPKFRISKIVPVGTEEEIVFTAPKEKGELVFTCSMGMYRGTFIVQ